MKIYTKTGDDGSTGLVTGERVPKHDVRVELYGTADELNSVLGCAISELVGGADDRARTHKAGAPIAPVDSELLEEVVADLVAQQHLLFELGSELAGFVVAPGESAVLGEDISFLEARIDRYTARLPVMRSFILPGGTRAASWLHLSRTVCRRLERMLSQATAASAALHPNLLVYLNRLSDFLFVVARVANQAAGLDDRPWTSRGRQERLKRKQGPPP